MVIPPCGPPIPTGGTLGKRAANPPKKQNLPDIEAPGIGRAPGQDRPTVVESNPHLEADLAVESDLLQARLHNATDGMVKRREL